MREAIERMLRLEGLTVVGVNSVEAFIAARFADPPACAVIDVNLGAVSGLTLQAWLAVDAPGLPVVMISANDREEVRRTAREQGCIAFLVKPFTGEALIGAVRQGLGIR